MGEAIREEHTWTPEQLAEATALMRRMESRIPALVAAWGEVASAVANMAAALAPLRRLLESDSMSPRLANPIGEQHGPCMARCVRSAPHFGQCSTVWVDAA
jgi:hypothetical protein